MAMSTQIIPELIEIGLDILNPVQPASMDPAKLKEDFGDRLCFWGSMDEQYTLPMGSPARCRPEVIKRIETLGKNGGLILGPTITSNWIPHGKLLGDGQCDYKHALSLTGGFIMKFHHGL